MSFSHDKFEVEVHGKYGVLPVKKEDGSVGYDIALPEEEGNLVMLPNTRRRIDTGIIIRPPQKCFALIVPRSSASKKGIWFSNTVGVIDPSYCGQEDTIKVDITRGPELLHYHGQYDPREKSRYHYMDGNCVRKCQDPETGLVHVFGGNPGESPVIYRAGERFCQVLFIPYYAPELVERSLEAFSTENRGGYGSTGQSG